MAKSGKHKILRYQIFVKGCRSHFDLKTPKQLCRYLVSHQHFISVCATHVYRSRQLFGGSYHVAELGLDEVRRQEAETTVWSEPQPLGRDVT